VLVHNEHGHAEDERTGCTGWLETLAEDASHGGYIAGGISVSYTDKGSGGVPALTATKQHVVQVKRQQVEYAQQLSGTTLGNIPAGEVDPGGGQVQGSLDPGDYIAINNNVNLGNVAKQITLRFAGGSATNGAGADRAAVEFRLDSPTGALVQTGTLKSTGTNNNTYTNQTFPLDFAGSHRLYLVFRAITATGAPATGFGNLNWVEFSGAGVGLAPDFFPQVPGTVGGNVPATLSLTLGTAATFGAFTPGVAKDYMASTTATVISTAGDAALSVADPSSTNTGHLVNGSFFLPQKLQAMAVGGAFAPVSGPAAPTTLKTWAAPTSNEAVGVTFKQSIAANDALRTGAYSKTLTFTLSTTTP
jgi:hypothetical protein